MPCRANADTCDHGVPFGFAQGRLSTAAVFRIREAQPPLRMTQGEGEWKLWLLLPGLAVIRGGPDFGG
jgi:hypothetical protein